MATLIRTAAFFTQSVSFHQSSKFARRYGVRSNGPVRTRREAPLRDVHFVCSSSAMPVPSHAEEYAVDLLRGICCTCMSQSTKDTTPSVAEIMTTGNIITCRPDTPLGTALEILVENHITGLPVVDDENRVVGIISDFDLLALEGVSEEEKKGGLFPAADKDWNSFFEVQELVAKNAGTCVSDVMTSEPVCVRPFTSIFSAAHLLLHKRIRRLPVVDERGRLIGIITRSNIIKAAWQRVKKEQ